MTALHLMDSCTFPDDCASSGCLDIGTSRLSWLVNITKTKIASLGYVTCFSRIAQHDQSNCHSAINSLAEGLKAYLVHFVTIIIDPCQILWPVHSKNESMPIQSIVSH